MDIITSNNQEIALIYRKNDWKPGLHFPTNEKHFIQVGCWHYNEGKILPPHKHKFHKRSVTKTQELIYIADGKIRLSLYSNRGKELKEVILEKGDFAVMFNGGHGYKIMENNTRVLEVKNGPFISVEEDKEPLS
ncbi:MAG: hypothetical protein OXB88_03885 [Bacteriovoracales bacterium]|nr:hypothetical protein [Bacteriovoracales bacterium]